VQFEWEDKPQPRAVRLVSASALIGDPVRVTVAGVEIEGRIEGVESSTLCVRIGRQLLTTIQRMFGMGVIAPSSNAFNIDE
jgi:hypothetical protein